MKLILYVIIDDLAIWFIGNSF